MLESYYHAAVGFLAPICTSLGALTLALFLVNLAFGRRSQIDAWCNAHPYAAGAMKIMRGVGHDPWQVLQGASLLIRKRLPDPIESVVDALVPPPASEIEAAARKVGKIGLVVVVAAGVLRAFTACSSLEPATSPTENVATHCATYRLDVDAERYAELMAAGCRGVKPISSCPAYAAIDAKYAPIYDDLALKCAAEAQ